jgi:3-methyladenine DNA glycosylase/8-oxoguanine DNA glycosylase
VTLGGGGLRGRGYSRAVTSAEPISGDSSIGDPNRATPILAELRPRGPYSLRLSARHGSDATRIVRDGVVAATLAASSGELERAHAWQRPDGLVCLQAATGEGIEQMRFMLGLDDDHSEFLRRFADDPLIGRATRHLRGLRPMRTATVAHALLRAVAGQLITASRARAIERTVIRAATRSLEGLHAAPTAADLARFSPAELRNLGLGARRGATLIRLCRGTELESLKKFPTQIAAQRLERERGLGPWSAGVVCLEGLGRYERGLARDLGLVKLASALWGRHVEAEETDALLAPYGEWAGLASVYMLAGYPAGLVGLPDENRDPRHRTNRRVAPRRAA